MRTAVGMLFLPINRTVTKTAHHQPIIANLPHNNIGLYLLKSFEASWNFYQISREGFAPAFIHIKNFFIVHTFRKSLIMFTIAASLVLSGFP